MAPRTVLLVDSHEDSRAIYRVILEHHGYAVVATSHVDEGMRLAGERRPDLIVMELAPPRSRSLDAVRSYRRDARTAAVPVVAVSTLLNEVDRDIMMAEGLAAYLVKPCSPMTLLAEARRILGN